MAAPRITLPKLAVLALLVAAVAWARAPRTPPPELVDEQHQSAEILSMNTATFTNAKYNSSTQTTTARVRLEDGGEAVLAISPSMRLSPGDRIEVRVSNYSDGSRRVVDGNSVF